MIPHVFVIVKQDLARTYRMKNLVEVPEYKRSNTQKMYSRRTVPRKHVE